MNWGIVVAIIGLCITAVITILGWSRVNYLTTIREDRSREIKYKIERCERQIEEFYGPLYNLVQQIVNVFMIQEEIFSKSGLSTEQRGKVEAYIKEHFFFPLHDEALKILRTRMQLVSDVPEDLWKYIKHVTQERVKHELVVQGFPARIEWEPFPEELWGVLENSLREAREQHDKLLQARAQHERIWSSIWLPIQSIWSVPLDK
jgi:hypothetical protein